MRPIYFSYFALLLILLGGTKAGGEGPGSEVFPLVTNLLQLRELSERGIGSVAGISLTGTVCDVSVPRGLLILQDGSFGVR